MDVSDSPPRKIFRTLEFGSPNFSDSVPNIDDVIDEVVETVDSLAQIFDAGGASITGSPGSVVAESEVSDVSLDQGIADKAARALRNAMSELKCLRIRADVASPTGIGDVKPDDVWQIPKGAHVDSVQLGFYDDPNTWPPALKRSYKRHIEHNIKLVRTVLGKDVVAARQVRDFFSLEAEIITVLDYPPLKEAGAISNLAFIASSKYTLKNKSIPVLGVKSVCIRQHAYVFARTSGLSHDSFELLETLDQDGSPVTVAVNAQAREALRFDLCERHPTTLKNDVNFNQLIKASSLGQRHLDEGDAIFAEFIKQRQIYVQERNRVNGSSKKGAPVFVWNAGFSRSGEERTGALAALFVSLELAGVEALNGIHHPSFIFRIENPLVQISAASYDRSVCDACIAAGRDVVDDRVWQRFVKVENMTPAERLVREREAKEFYSALGKLAWMSEGKLGTHKRAVYDALVAVGMGHEAAAHMAQARALFDGQLQAAARRAGVSAEELAGMSAEDKRSLVEKDTFEGKVRAAATRAGLGDEELAGMSAENQKELVRLKLLENACEALGENFTAVVSSEWSEEEREELIHFYRMMESFETLGMDKDHVSAFSAEERRQVLNKFNKRLILQKMGVIMPDEEDDDDEDDVAEGERIDITYDIAMSLSLSDLWSLVALTRDRGMTPKTAAAVTCAMKLGIAREEAETLSAVDLKLAQMFYRNRTIQERKMRALVFRLPGTPGHAEVVHRIELHLKICGVSILMNVTHATDFAKDWAFWVSGFGAEGQRNDLCDIYISDEWRGIPIWVNARDQVNRTLGIENAPYAKRLKKSMSQIADFVYRSRFDLFQDKLEHDALERLVPRVPFSSRSVDTRIVTHVKIEQNKEHEYFFAGDETFENELRQLSADRSAEFDMEGNWTSRICLKRMTKMGRGRPRYYNALYFCDDEGVWAGPRTHWGLLENERPKVSAPANIEVLNALDARLGTASAA